MNCYHIFILSIVCCTAIISPSAAFSILLPNTRHQRSVLQQKSKIKMVNTAIDLEGDGIITKTLAERDLYSDNLITFDDGPCVEVGHLIEYCPIDHMTPQPKNSNAFIEKILSSYIGPRVILALVAILYGTNFSLGALMNDNLPASAATSGRMVLAALVLSPFLLQLKPNLRPPVLLGGAFVSLGYVSQSIALIDTSPATVSFLGSCTVLVCPLLQWIVNKKPMGIKDAPQTWLAAFLCLSGVATLELFDASSSASSFSLAESMSRLGVGDALSLVQACGFGVGIFMSEKMMKEEPEAALPITAGMVATTAFFSMIWCFADGWMREPGWESLGLPGLFLDPNMRSVAMAVAWTGILSTSTNFCIEITALGRVPSSEASVILATEPLWASLFAAILLHEQFGTNDYIGGVLMISACLVNTLKPSFFRDIFGEN
jgi:drug/metabolite transporter (DMT)-like permease